MAAMDDLGSLIKIYWSLFLGNIVEWYEFACYGYCAVYLQKNIFNGSPVAVWLGFGVTFFARPFGGLVLGLLGDLFGRSVAVNLSIIGMLIGTVGQGLLPTYALGDAAGNAGIVLLVLCRLLQGLSAAGEISTISAYITEVSPHKTLGRSISLIGITANLGFLSAKTITYITRTALGEEVMTTWGWRVPFIFALVPGLIAVMGRSYLPESEAFLESQQELKRSDTNIGDNFKRSRAVLSEVFSRYWRNVIIGVGGVASFAIMQYGGFIWMQHYLASRGMAAGDRMQIALCSRLLMIGLGLPVGWLTDIKGVGWVTLVAAALLTAFALPIFALIDAYPTSLAVGIATIGVFFSLIGALAGNVFFLFVAELFPTAVRGVGAGISYNIGFAIFGGLAPTAAQLSLGVNKLGPGFILMAGGAITTVTVIAGLRMERKGQMLMAHVRAKPYLGAGIACDKSDTDSTGVSSTDEQSTDSESGAESS